MPIALLTFVAALVPAVTPAVDADARLAAYSAIVRAYHQGSPTAPSELLGWDAKALTEAVEAVRPRNDSAQGWEPWAFRSAAMCHTDAARLAAGEPARPAAHALHLRLAIEILAKGGNDPPFVDAWIEQLATSLRARHELELAWRLLELTRTRFPTSARALFESGVTAEYFAVAYTNGIAGSPGGNAVIRGTPVSGRRGTVAAWPPTATRWRAEHLADAEEWLSRGRKAGGALAPLHLARVLMLQGKSADALRVATDALEHTTDPALAYLAALLAGSALEADGRIDEAAARYRVAIDRFPSGQFAYIALSEASYRLGRYADARAAVDAMLTRAAQQEAREPWWFFASDMMRIDDDPFAALRAVARR